MDYKLIAIDIDGTLVDDDKKLPQANIDAMKAASEAGAEIMIATGRPYKAASWVFEQAGMEGLIMSVGGALITHYPSDEIIYSAVLPPDFVREFAAYCNERGWFFHCLSGSDINYPKVCKESELTEKYFGYKGRVLDFASDHGIVFNKADPIIIDGTIREVAAELNAKFGDVVEILVSDAVVIDIMPKGVNKAVSMLAVAQSRGLTADQVIAIGDQDSDISMIKAAGLGVCMVNGSENTLKAADYIAPSNNDCGVAHVIRKFVL